MAWHRLKLIAAVFVVLANPASALAVSSNDVGCVLAGGISGTCWYNPSAGSQCSGAASSLPAGTLPSFVPEPYNGAFTAGAKKHNVAPALIAALFSEENFTGTDPDKLPQAWANLPKRHPDPNSGWPTNQYNTEGAFQFIPDTWAAYGDDGNGDGVKDPQNIADGAAGAANYVAANGATADKPEASWQNAIFHYNHAQWYVDAVLKYYDYYNSGGQSTGQTAPSTAPTTSICGGSGGTGVSPDGFVFPQKTTKAQLASQKPYAWSPTCKNPIPEMGPGSTLPGSDPARDVSGLCHHDYLAADIFNTTGTPVVAPRPGIVESYHDGGSVGWTIRIYSDKKLGGDGLWYYLAHMKKPSEGGTLFTADGQTVKAGDQVGAVGTPADAEGTEQHTHIDISPVDNSFSRGYTGTDGPLLDPMPALYPAWQALPD